MSKNLLIERFGNIGLKLTSVQVTGECRPLRVAWTPELAQDLNYYTSVNEPTIEPANVYKKRLLIEKYIPKLADAEKELTEILSQEIANSINRDILTSLLNLGNE